MNSAAWIAERQAWERYAGAVEAVVNRRMTKRAVPAASVVRSLYATWRAAYEERLLHHPPEREKRRGEHERSRARLAAKVLATRRLLGAV